MRPSPSLLAACAAAALPFATSSSISGAAGTPVADKVIIISRHGIRRQFPSSDFNFTLYAPSRRFAVDDADWGVDSTTGMGVLTRHGYDAVKLMGAYQGQRYAHLAGGGGGGGDFEGYWCDRNVFVYGEADMPRDVKTAEAFFVGWGCDEDHPPKVHSHDAEYLIDQGSKPRGPKGECAMGTEAQVGGRVGGGSLDSYVSLYRPLLRKLSNLLGCCAPELCSDSNKDGNGKCSLEDLPTQWDAEHWYTTYTGPMYAGKYFAEWIELTMLNGMEYGWNELTTDDVMELSSFTTQYREFEFDILAARPFGSALLAHVLATLLQWSDPLNSVASQGRAVQHPPQTSMVYYAAHDTNLRYIAGLLNLKWISEGGWRPNHTPPGGMLIFEAYSPTNPSVSHDPTYEYKDEWHVAAFFDVQTPEQMRELTVLRYDNGGEGGDDGNAARPSRVPVTIPGCSLGRADLLCPVSLFANLVKRAVRPECVTPPALRSIVEDNDVSIHAPSAEVFLVIAIMFLASLALVLLLLLLSRRRDGFSPDQKTHRDMDKMELAQDDEIAALKEQGPP